MDKAHDVEQISFTGATMALRVDGRTYRVDIRKHSRRLAAATRRQRENFEVSPSGYGIHWPDLDEDLSVAGLIGSKHPSPTPSAANR